MRVLMLGWEFPPVISGGLGTACHGLTRALSQQGVEIVFVLPQMETAPSVCHVNLIGAQQLDRLIELERQEEEERAQAETRSQPGEKPAEPSIHPIQQDDPSFSNVTFRTVQSRVISPYQSSGGEVFEADQPARVAEHAKREAASTSNKQTTTDPPRGNLLTRLRRQQKAAPTQAKQIETPSPSPYQGDIVAEAHRYAFRCVQLAARHDFDVVHAHDWMTYPAGLAIAATTGKPLVVHMHSTEFDRSGEHVYQPVYDIERRGLHGADRIVTVSYLTRSIIADRYGIEQKKVDVVYNGVERGRTHHARGDRIRTRDRIVLFLGRITMQKGPEFFVSAAKRVLEKMPNVKFVMAGSGDRITSVMSLAAEEGIDDKIVFTGFLQGGDVERVFRMADVYVMPSVSEPFGIAPLEAISHDVPVIISRTSGVSEVLSHVLKVDFWDVDQIANKIIAVLRHPPLSRELREHADLEVRRLTWDDAATQCIDLYLQMLQRN